MTTSSTTLYDQLGGVESIAAVVDDFYLRVLADPLLASFFEGVNMQRQRGRQTEFLAAALGGPDAWTGPSMATVHAGRGIAEQHFTAVAGHLTDALGAAGVGPDLTGQVIGLVATLAPQIVSGAPAPRSPEE